MHFCGSRGDDLGADPWDFSMECRAADSAEWDVWSPGLTDGNPNDFEVAPGEELLIRVSNEFASRYKNRQCHLALWLRDKSTLKSNDFVP